MTYQQILTLQSTLSKLDLSSLSVPAKIKYYGILQDIEPELDKYQRVLADVVGDHTNFEDLSPKQAEEVESLLGTEVELCIEAELAQDDLPDNISIAQIGVLDRAGVLNLDKNG